MQSIGLAVLVSYLLGSIPSGYILVKLVRKVDIRQYGSGNIGATNVTRLLGSPAGIVVLIFDIAKGILATAVVADLFEIYSIVSLILLAVSVVVGHNWTIFLRFHGGKGVATTIGAVAGLALKITTLAPVLILSLLIWLAVFILFRIVAIASIVSAVSLSVFMVVFKQPIELVVLGIIFSTLIIIRHKPNIVKMLEKKNTKSI